jgi:hypothetical protein
MEPKNIELLNEIIMISDKKILINEINEFIELNEKQKTKKMIKMELEKKEKIFKHDKKYYRNLIFFSKSKDVLDEIDLELIFCKDNPDLRDIWKYFKIMSSSAVTSDDGFGSLKIMIKDKISNKYLGILEISNDIMSCEARDNYIGWSKKIKLENININNNLKKSRSAFIINITCCIGLQPMAYNLNIGKLLVKTVFCKEVLDYFYKNRGYYYAGVTTFGLYGKSIQYDRLKEIKYIGNTKGTGTSCFPDYLYNKIFTFVKKYYPNEHLRRSLMSSSKMRILQFGLNQLDYNHKEILNHGHLRGIYFGYTSNESKDFLNGIKNSFQLNNIKTFNETVNEWKTRWANQRLNNLLLNNRFKITYELKDFTINEKKNEYAKQYQYEKISDEIYIKHKKEKNAEYYIKNKNKIMEVVNINLENLKKNDQYLYPEYIGGFFDSDGSIFFDCTVLKINFSQCVLNILLLIQKQYGGILYSNNRKTEKRREQYSLVICGEYTKKIIDDLEKTSILKIDKIKIAKQYLSYINKENNEEKISLINKFKQLLKKQDDKIYFDRINWKYIAGIFDGDGCITLNYKNLENEQVIPRFDICQKYAPNFLKYIKTFMDKELNNNFYVSKYCVQTSKRDNILNIYDKIKNYIIVKKYQFECLKNILIEYKNKNLNFNLIYELALEMKINKHKDVNYELNILENNMISSITTNIVKEIDSINEKNIEKETYTKIIQSDKKIGINNPNYGQHLSNEHALNISIATTISKRSNNPNLTNEKIREIYDLKDKMMQKDVAEKYEMSREMIRRIWNRSIIPTDDPEFLIKKTELVSKDKSLISDDLTFEQKTSIGKRSLKSEQYIEIILWKIKKNNGELLNEKKIYSTTLSEYLSKLWNTKVTNDMIKNIWCGKTKLFDFEFNNAEITYEKYLEIIK